MYKKLGLVFGMTIGLVLAIGFVFGAQAQNDRLASHTLPLQPQADGSWSSGWVDIAPGAMLTFTHSLNPGTPERRCLQLSTVRGDGAR